MIKRDELSDPHSCLNRSRYDEPLFVLCGRDPSFAWAVRAWAQDRLALRLNQPDDPQIVEALKLAQEVSDAHRDAGEGKRPWKG